LYEPLSKLSVEPPREEEEDGKSPVNDNSPIFALDLLLLSLVRTQSRLARSSEDASNLMETMRREWSEAYRVQMA
jgi:hypothetical protein